jgi:hypothetical protein
MKKLVLSIIVSFFTVATNAADAVNAVIGNESLLFNTENLPLTEQNRIRLHLNYVVKKLYNKDVQYLPLLQQQNRFQMLHYLFAYAKAGQFPQNIKYKHQRKPCFIDDKGAICAVGYLIAQSAGLDVAKYINSKFQYNLISEMHDPVLEGWISNSGLTKEECAMIQPSYGFPPTNEESELQKGDAIITGLCSGISVSAIMINGFGSGRFQQSKALPAIGIVTGVTQLAYGIALFPDTKNNFSGGITINTAERNASIINMGLGTANLLMSTWRLLSNTKSKDKRTVWNIYSTPSIHNSTVYGFRLGRRIG